MDVETSRVEVIASLCLSLVLFAGCRTTDQFMLLRGGGKEPLGPFTFKSGEEIDLSGETFIIKRTVPEDQALQELLNAIRVSDLCVMGESVRDALVRLEQAANDSPVKEKWKYRNPLNFQLVASADAQRQMPSISIVAARNVSIYDLLLSVAKQAKLRLVIRNGNVWLEQAGM